jgi:hypothetical protein
MSNNKDLNELLNKNFKDYKEEKKNKILKEQEEILNHYNKEIIPYNNLNNLQTDNFYTNYFNNINNIIVDLFYYNKWVSDGRLFYLGITFIFISLIFFIYKLCVTFYKKMNKKIE